MSKHTAPATLAGTYFDLIHGIDENFTYADRKGKYRGNFDTIADAQATK